MPARRSVLERTRQELAAIPNVSERKMFGATAFLVNNKMCVCADENSIMCRIDPARHEESLAKPGCTTVVMRGRNYTGYVNVDGDALKTKAALKYWIGLALEFNAVAKRSRTKSS